MHARRTARDAYFPSSGDDAFFAPRGDIVFADTSAARRFADRINLRDRREAQAMLRPAEAAAMALVHEILHEVLGLYRKRHPESFDRLRARLETALGGDGARQTLRTFVEAFPPPGIYERQRAGEAVETSITELFAKNGEDAFIDEILLLWVTNQNRAYAPIRAVVSDEGLGETYEKFVATQRDALASEPAIGPRGETLIDLLLAPSRHSDSILEQLRYIEDQWGPAFGLEELSIWRRVLWARDFLKEEGKYFFRGGPGPGSPLLEPMRFGTRADEEVEAFSQDLDWMPNVVLIAKTVYVWLDQLTKKYGRAITTLDAIPDEELGEIAARGFTGLWLIGLFERSRSSKKIKQTRGDHDAVASAYSLKGYAIADELGGYGAYENLKGRAWARGLRLAADMVPNHVGIDGDWVIEHPDWFVQSSQPPFPSYRFGGQDLSDDPRVGVFIEEGYWNQTDAAVVFRRHDRQTGHDRFIYHGNDGTSMPWNDTAQLDYTKAEVRHAVIETIIHVARMFPIIRFDAAMTLAKRHVQRLWFPLPGHGGAIPSRSDYAMTQEEFDRAIPIEFWREVVDTVAARAPDTLLLAEAFWMMEGYFVRTLGMHRVYNSAFMNMLKREENGKYRETIKNVLAFDPQVLKRFVNFMNNPDEETAVAQFGADDKYFGVCVLMITLPGLPMFGHGQIEGFKEKYGMEYRRARWTEHPNEGLVARHEREIFPILKRRWLFSNVESFVLYDFVTESGDVDEDVYAYSNRAGDEAAIVLFNNKFKTTRGRIRLSPSLGLEAKTEEWLVLRDLPNGLEYIRPMREVLDGGLAWQLDAFKYAVFVDLRGVSATDELPYGDLAKQLEGRGVPSIDEAARDLRFLPIHAPLLEALGKGHRDWLAQGWDGKTKTPKPESVAALVEKLGHVADGIAYFTGKPIAPGMKDAAIAKARTRYEALLRTDTKVHAARTATTHEDTTTRDVVLAWLQLDAVISMLGREPASLDRAIARAFDAMTTALILATLAAPSAATPDPRGGGNAAPGAHARTTAAASATPPGAQATTTAPANPDGSDAYTAPEATGEHGALAARGTALLAAVIVRAFDEPYARAFLGVHEAGGVVWFVKEAYEALVRVLAVREVVEGWLTEADATDAREDLLLAADKAGYRDASVREVLNAAAVGAASIEDATAASRAASSPAAASPTAKSPATPSPTAKSPTAPSSTASSPTTAAAKSPRPKPPSPKGKSAPPKKP